MSNNDYFNPHYLPKIIHSRHYIPNYIRPPCNVLATFAFNDCPSGEIDFVFGQNALRPSQLAPKKDYYVVSN